MNNTNASYLNEEIISIIQSKGGFFTPEIIEDDSLLNLFTCLIKSYEDKCTFCKNNLYNEKPRDIYFSFVNETSLNAFAYASPDNRFDFVGINVGSVFTFLTVFGRLLSHPDFMVDVGNANLEISDRSNLPFLMTDVVSQGGNLDWAVPECDTRNAYVFFMTQAALDFLFFHEITHLRSGHLEWNRFYAQSHFYEEAIRESYPDKAFTSQAFEMDADSGAILCLLNQYYEIFDRIDWEKDFPRKIFLFPAYGTRKSLVRLIFISVYTLFRVFNFSSWDIVNQEKLSHPQPPIRQHWINLTILELFGERSLYEYDQSEYLKDTLEFLYESEKGISLLLRDQIDARGILSVIRSDIAEIHLQKIKARWSEIRPQLLDFKRGGKLPE